MTVTDEERRKAARKLRELTVCDGVDAFDIAKALRLEAVSRTEYDTESVRRLADLIEPQERTCHFGWFWDEYDMLPRYCPHCCAKVMVHG